MKKAILLFSGGPDSTSAVYLLKDSKELTLFTVHEPVHTRNNSEVACSQDIARRLSLTHKIVDIASSGQLFDDVGRIAIGLGGGNRPGKGSITSFNHSKVKCVRPDQTEAPFSLAFLHLTAAIYAAAHDIDEVVWAVHADDDIPHGWITDYVQRFNALIKIFGSEVSLVVPFVGQSKRDLLSAGLANGAPLDHTFSCLMNSNGVHCGECEGCIERSRAFKHLCLNGRPQDFAKVA